MLMMEGFFKNKNREELKLWFSEAEDGDKGYTKFDY